MQVHTTLLARVLQIVAALAYSVALSMLTTHALRRIGQGMPQNRYERAIRECILAPSDGCTLDDVGGLPDAKRELRRWVILPMRYPDIFYGQTALRPSKGVLLHGPPGTGKTMLARAVASEAGVPFVSLHASALESKWFGESPKLLSATFTLARSQLAPCIVFFDEVDALGRARTETDQSCVYSMKCELLRNMDGVEAADASPVVVLACTNFLSSLDAALRRRFGRVVHVGLPDEAERLDILRTLTKSETHVAGTLAKVAAASAGMSGADLAALYGEASMSRMNRSTVEDRIADGTIATADDLVHHLGPLSAEHWFASGRLRKDAPSTSKARCSRLKQ